MSNIMLNSIKLLRKVNSLSHRLVDQIARWWVGIVVSDMEPDCRVLGFPIIELRTGAAIHIGSRVVLCSRSVDTALGVSRPIILRALGAGAQITIGDDSGLSGTTICAINSVVIGHQCLFGADVMIADTDFHPIAPEGRRYSDQGVASSPVKIGNNVFIGARTIILKGVTIGDNSIVGAGSLVTRDIPANVIAAGNPARILGPVGHPPASKTN